jgi:hypothetical protein
MSAIVSAITAVPASVITVAAAQGPAAEEGQAQAEPILLPLAAE